MTQKNTFLSVRSSQNLLLIDFNLYKEKITQLPFFWFEYILNSVKIDFQCVLTCITYILNTN